MNPEEEEKRDDSDSSATAESGSSSSDSSASGESEASTSEVSNESSSSSSDSDKAKDAEPSSETDSSSYETEPKASKEESSSKPEAAPSKANSTEFKDTVDSPQSHAMVVNSDRVDAVTGGRREDRRSWVQNINLTLDYISKASNDKKLHFRSSDHLTSNLLIGAFVLSVGFATLPFFEMNAIAALAYVLADALLFGAITVFVISRFGIIRAMDPRHALVCWHLMVGTGLLALVIGFNIVASVVLVMMHDKLPLLFPGG